MFVFSFDSYVYESKQHKELNDLACKVISRQGFYKTA